MSTGKVSSKEGHDESHIDDTKLRTYFLNDVNIVTIGLTQRYWYRDRFDCRGKTSSTSLWTSGGTTKYLAAWLNGTNTQCDNGQCILLKDSKEWHDSWKWIVTKINWIPNWLTWLCRQVPCSKVMTNDCHYLQNYSLSHFPHHDWWVPLLGFMSSKRVTNTWYSLS